MCLLVVNDSSNSEKIVLKYNSITQRFLVSWNDWGWTPISLLKEYDGDQKVKFEISAENPITHLKISKVYLRYADIDSTD